MPQTLFALAAIVCFGYLALANQRVDQSVDTRAIAAEVDLAAVDVARGVMTEVEQSAFDEDDTGRSGVRTQPSPLALGPDEGETRSALYDDVDDWTGYETVRTVPAGQSTLAFQVFVTVRYVDDDDVDQAAKKATLTKEITVVAVETLPEGAGRPAATVTLRRVVTPAGHASTSPTS